MTEDFSKYYEILGVAPGVSKHDLKAAHRDLAKVWHPDRFGHDPRLQAKAQEKLKDINDAYEQLSTGKTRRRPAPPVSHNHSSTRTSTPVYDHGVRLQKSAPRWPLVALALVIFGAAFYFTTTSLIGSSTQQNTIGAVPLTEQTSEADHEQEAGARVNSGESRTKNQDDRSTEATEPVMEPAVTAVVNPVETKTVVIDPETGLLARAECPLKSRTTYALGNEPHQYCTSHTPELAAAARAKEGKIKTAARRLTSASKWLEGK